MQWKVTDQALRAYESAEDNDRPTMIAFDHLWARLSLDPVQEGISLNSKLEPLDSNMKRVMAAIRQIPLPKGGSVRLAYEPIEGPSAPPSWLAFALFVPDFEPDSHLLIALGRCDRHGKVR